jgi:hypothetical protein
VGKTTRNWRDRRESRSVNGAEETAGSASAIRPLLTEQEVSALLHLPAQTLRNARTSGTGGFATLPWLKLGTLVRYRAEDVERWLAERERVHERPGAAG